jgi:hypothetical protein
MITKAGDRLIPPRMTIRCKSNAPLIWRNRTVTMNKDTSASRKGGIYELLGSEAMMYRSVQMVTTKICHPNLGNKRIKFCSSESCTSRTRYSKDPRKRGRTEKDSLTSRMQTLCGTAEQSSGVCTKVLVARHAHVRDPKLLEGD